MPVSSFGAFCEGGASLAKEAPPHLASFGRMGSAHSSVPGEAYDIDSFDDFFFSTDGAVKTCTANPWGSAGVTLNDVAMQACVILSVLQAAGEREDEAIELLVGPEHSFDTALLADLRHALNYGIRVPDADVYFHVRRILTIATFYKGHLAFDLDTIKHRTLHGLARFFSQERPPLQRLPMFFVTESRIHGVTTCYLHGLEIVRSTRSPGTMTLCLHAGPASPSTPLAITSACRMLLPSIRLVVATRGDDQSWILTVHQPADGSVKVHDFFNGIELVAQVAAADDATRTSVSL